MSEVWFAIPSASVERCRERLPVWRAQGYKIAILQNVEKGDVDADIVEWFDYYPGWGESINILCRDIIPASADLIVSGGDDMLPDPNKTAQELASEFFERFSDGFGVMQPCGDAYRAATYYCGSPWIGRAYWETMYEGTGPMWGGYKHNWGDLELYQVARCMGALWMRDDVGQYHHHVQREGETEPDWWMRNVADHDRRDNEMYLSRKFRGFPGYEPQGRSERIDKEMLFDNGVCLGERYWMRMFAPHEIGARSETTILGEAFSSLAQRGVKKVAIYGAGTHTRQGARAFATPPVEIVGVIDDSPQRQGSKLFGFPVVSREQAIESGAEAVVISSDSFEKAIYEQNREAFQAKGVELVRLYDQQAVEAKDAPVVPRGLSAGEVSGDVRNEAHHESPNEAAA